MMRRPLGPLSSGSSCWLLWNVLRALSPASGSSSLGLGPGHPLEVFTRGIALISHSVSVLFILLGKVAQCYYLVTIVSFQLIATQSFTGYLQLPLLSSNNKVISV